MAIPAAAAGFVDGGFEAQGSADPAIAEFSYCVFVGEPGCSISNVPWLGATSSGLARTDAGDIQEGAALSGSYVGFVGGGGALAQGFTVQADGYYRLSWFDRLLDPTLAGGYAALLGRVADEDYKVDLGTNVETDRWTRRTLAPLFLKKGDEAIVAFVSLDGESGGATLFDNVTLSAVPEPASWTMMIAGFGFIGAAMRRRVVHPRRA